MSSSVAAPGGAAPGAASPPGGVLFSGELSLKDRQRDALCRMLSAAGSSGSPAPPALPSSDEWSDEWKVLVYDAHCRDIISTLLNVTQLRKRGVTLHLLLHSEREPLPDVPAVYFCEPTAENVRRIAQDCSAQLYSEVRVNFSTKVDRLTLESMAKEAVKEGGSHLISSVHDQYLHFITLEPRLFSLGSTGSLVAYNDPGASEESIHAFIREITYGLLSVLSTLKAVPVIRAAPGGPGQMVAEQLSQLICDQLDSGGGLFAVGGGAPVHSRPLLLIVERTADLVTPLRHTSTYQALIDDVLEHRVNRVTVMVDGPPGQPRKKKTYDVNSESDTFYARYKGCPFPEAIEANGSELSGVTQREEEIRRMTSAAGINADTAAAAGGRFLEGGAGNDGSTRELASAVESLPGLIEHKKALEMHTNILKAAMDVVASRHIPTFFEAEEEAIASHRNARTSVEKLLASSTGSLHDKIRLLGVYCLAARLPSEVVSEFEGIMRTSHQSAGGDPAQLAAGIAAISYLRKQIALQHLPTADSSKPSGGGLPGPSPAAAGNQFMQGLLAKAQTQATGLLAKAASTATQLLSGTNKTYIARVVENVLKGGEEDDTYMYIDPRLKGQRVPPDASLRHVPREVIVFVIGGGSYAEFQNLQDLAARHTTGGSGRNLGITYGCTELLNAEGLLGQLAQLGGACQ
jgi:hypothetical protein